jgi:hypothetical protein
MHAGNSLSERSKMLLSTAIPPERRLVSRDDTELIKAMSKKWKHCPLHELADAAEKRYWT